MYISTVRSLFLSLWSFCLFYFETISCLVQKYSRLISMIIFEDSRLIKIAINKRKE